MSDEAIANALPHPGWSHTKGSDVSYAATCESRTVLTVIGVPAHVRGQRRRFTKALPADGTDKGPVSYVALQVAEHLLPRREHPSLA